MLTMAKRVFSGIFLFFLAVPLNLIGQAPQAPANLTVLDMSFDFVLLMWDDNSDDEDYFIVQRHVSGEEFSNYDTVPENESLFLDYRVEPAKTYFYRVLAVNTDGASDFSNEIEITTLNIPSNKPLPPSNLNGFFDGVSSIHMSWVDNSTNEMRFYIYRSANDGLFTLIDSVNRDVRVYTDTPVEPNTTYRYYLRATNNYELSDPSDTLQIEVGDIIVPETPQLSLTHVDNNNITLKWDISAVSNSSLFLSRSSHESDSTFEIANSTVHTDSLLTENTRYTYQLLVINQTGDTALSNIISTTTLPWFTKERTSDSLVAFFLFSGMPTDSIQDHSWNGKPVNLHIQDTNNIKTTSGNYIRIAGDNMLWANETAKLIHSCKNSNEISIECWIKPSGTDLSKPAKIISLENEQSLAFSLGSIESSDKPGYIKYYANLTTKSTDHYGSPQLSSNESFSAGILHHVMYVHNHDGHEKIYINGKLTSEAYRPPGFDNWGDSYQLLMANNTAKEAPWLGDLYLSAIYSRALTHEEVLRNYYSSPFSSTGYVLNSANYTIHAYPNPGNDYLSVEFKNASQASLDVTQVYTLSIVSTDGKLLVREIISEFLTDNILTIDISMLEAGLYTLVLSNSIGIISEQKLSVIH